MATYLICYDINKEGAAYSTANKKVIDAIKDLFQEDGHDWWHHLDSTWIVTTPMTALQIRNALKPMFDTNDELLVVKSAGIGAWHGFNAKASTWLETNL